MTNFVEGQWVGWTVDEPVTVQVRKTSGNNTVMSGLFLSEVAGADTTAPTVAATTSSAPNAAGWHRELPLTVAITGDDGAGSGIDTLEYALGDGPWAMYSAPVAITADTTAELRYRAHRQGRQRQRRRRPADQGRHRHPDGGRERHAVRHDHALRC